MVIGMLVLWSKRGFLAFEELDSYIRRTVNPITGINYSTPIIHNSYGCPGICFLFEDYEW